MESTRDTTTLEIIEPENRSGLARVCRRFFIFDPRILHHLLQLWRNRYLLYALTRRGVRARYKQSLLGVGWALLIPAAMTIVATYIFTRAKLDEHIHSFQCPFPIYVLCMLTFWSFFQKAVTNGSTALVSNMDLVTKVCFPREVLPISSVLMNLVDLFFAFLMFMIVAFAGTHLAPLVAHTFPRLASHFTGAYLFLPHVRWLWVPVFLALLCLFTVGLVFFASAMQVYFRDVSHLIGLALSLWMFLTPVFYPLRALAGGRFTTLIILNPVTGLLDGIRLALIARQSPWEHHVIYAAVFSVGLFLVGYSFFKHEERYFADVV